MKYRNVVYIEENVVYIKLYRTSLYIVLHQTPYCFPMRTKIILSAFNLKFNTIQVAQHNNKMKLFRLDYKLKISLGDFLNVSNGTNIHDSHL